MGRHNKDAEDGGCDDVDGDADVDDDVEDGGREAAIGGSGGRRMGASDASIGSSGGEWDS